MTAELLKLIAAASPERAALLAALVCLGFAGLAVSWLARQLAEARAELKEDYNLQRALLARLGQRDAAPEKGDRHEGNQALVFELVDQSKTRPALPLDGPVTPDRPAGLTLDPPRKTYTKPTVTRGRRPYIKPTVIKCGMQVTA
jgi:hypothetical protein